jgi:hypothetical protein
MNIIIFNCILFDDNLKEILTLFVRITRLIILDIMDEIKTISSIITTMIKQKSRIL